MDHLTDEQMMALFRDEMPPAEADAAEEHLHSCSQCLPRYDELLRIGELPPPDESSEILSTLKCVICQNTTFETADYMLNTRLATYFGVEWINRTAFCYICRRCGYVHWFLK